ncbi:OmpP1/FadL family transporter [Lutibacter holmesii]|uniref:OmpP1/FadL family transporter n=1 Tax=Lutibacter holmesii TaxID=1137985 RepID=A0ABW3WNS3_9FLAO
MKNLLKIMVMLFTAATFAQAGHIMQGVGAVNMSMGGAATAMPLDISGAIQWNPATLSAFEGKILDFSVGAFSSSPELSSSVPAGMMFTGSPAVSGVTEDDRGISPMPALAFVYGKEGSKSTFGISAFGISGFGVTFPQETNLPMDAEGNPNASWNPNDSNPISYPQNMSGFGHIESDYMLLQVSLSWSYEILKGLSLGIQPNINYASLELAPSPISSPSMTLGYPNSDKATAVGFGAQFGLYYASEGGVNIGASYKTAQSFSDFEFNNTYLDGSAAPDTNFNMDYPAILSFGVGYSTNVFDIAFDYRNVDYTNTNGFADKGWTQTGSVQGFGWNDVHIFSAGFQLKLINKLPLRFGYTHSTNPIEDELAFFSIPATAVIKNAVQFGLGYEFSDNFKLNGVYHYGTSGGSTSGNLLNPLLASSTNPYGAIPVTSVGYKMNTSMIMLGLSYNFAK